MSPVIRNIFAVGSGDAITRVIGFFITVYLARTLGPAYFGVISLGLSVIAYLDHLSGAGIRLLETRDAAAEKEVDDQRVRTVISLRLVLGTAVVIVTATVSLLMLDSADVRDVIILYSLMVIPLAFSLDWFFQGKERFQLLTGTRILTHGIYAAVVFLFVGGEEDFLFAPAGLVIGTLVSSVLLLGIFRKDHKSVGFVIDPGAWKKVLLRSLLPGLALLLAQSAVNLGPIVISIGFTSADVGMYSSAMKIIIVLLLMDRVLNSVFLPLISRVRAQRPEETGTIVNITLKISLVASLPLAVCCFVAAPSLIALIFGGGYGASTSFLRWLIPFFVLTLPNSVFACTLLADGKEEAYTRTLLGGSLILALLVSFFPFILGPSGAAAGVSAGELIMFIMFLMQARKVVGIELLHLFLRVVPALLAMIVAIVFLQGESAFIVFPVGVTIFLILVLVMGGLSRREMIYLGERIT